MKHLAILNPVRKELESVITNAVKHHVCIGTYYKNIGKHHTEDQTTEEYTNSPVVVVHNKEYRTYGGFEAASVYDLFFDDEKQLILTLNGESGEDWDEPLKNVQVEGLMCILAWLTENNFIVKNDQETRLIDRFLEDDEKCERFAEILLNEIRTDQEPLHKIGRQFIRAYLQENPEMMLIALCGWTMDTLIGKVERSDKDVFLGETDLYQKLVGRLKHMYIPEKYDDQIIEAMAHDEFWSIKQQLCEELGFDEDEYQRHNDGESPFDDEREAILEEIKRRVKNRELYGIMAREMLKFLNMETDEGFNYRKYTGTEYKCVGVFRDGNKYTVFDNLGDELLVENYENFMDALSWVTYGRKC